MRRPDLIVPIRDRRQHKRYLTLRNTSYTVIVLLIAFLSVSIWNEVRPHGRGSYGHLFERTLPKVEQKPVEVVQEKIPSTETEAAVPMEIVDTDTTASAQPFWEIEGAHETSVLPEGVRHGQSGVTIVGGPEGVSIVRTERRKPVLSGGFGR